MSLIQDSSVEECQNLLQSDSPALNDKFNVWYGTNIDNRLELLDEGVVALALDIVRKNSPNHVKAVEEAWKMFSVILIVQDVDNEQEYVPIAKFVDLGGIPLMAAEFERRRVNLGDTEMLLTFAWVATNDYATPHIIQTEVVHKYAISVIKQGVTHGDFDTAMSFVRTASACYSTRSKLRADGALDVVLPYIDDLKKTDDLAIRRGFRAGSVVARLAGNDEQGIGPRILRGNPVLIAKTVEILDRVLDAGPQGTVINMSINPHFITMDLLTISTSDANKPLLKNAIPVLIKALHLRGETNEEMVVDIVKTLLQLTFDKECYTLMQNRRDDLLGPLQRLVVPPKYNTEAIISALNLTNMFSTRPQVTSGKSGRFGALVRKAVSKESSKPPSDGKERRKSSSLAAPGDKHVMLSYNWEIKPLVYKVDEILRSNGIKTWLDDRDMGPNLNDSMANAIEDAYVLFAFMTSRYKESANCRKECEYADDQKIPIVYLMAEEGYKPNGWLGLQLGKSLWVGCWTLEMIEANKLSLVQRAKLTSAPTVVTTIATTQAKATGTSPDLLAMLTAMKAQLDTMASSLEQVKASQELLRSNQETIRTNQVQLQNVVTSIEKKLDLR